MTNVGQDFSFFLLNSQPRVIAKIINDALAFEALGGRHSVASVSVGLIGADGSFDCVFSPFQKDCSLNPGACSL